MTLADVLSSAIHPALVLFPSKMETDAACVMLLAIGLQESGFEHREQIGGPARGFWQFEKGGITGVLSHPTTSQYAEMVCAVRGVAPMLAPIYAELSRDDVLAAAFARLLLWSDAEPLPPISDVDAAWALYLRTWRPGKPRRETWDAFYQRAVTAVTGSNS